MEKLLDFFKVCSDETRLRLIMLLKEADLCVCELFALLELSQPKVSKHLTKLKDLGFVKTKRQEKFVFYSLDLSHAFFIETIEAIKTNLADYPQLSKDYQAVLKYLKDRKDNATEICGIIGEN